MHLKQCHYDLSWQDSQLNQLETIPKVMFNDDRHEPILATKGNSNNPAPSYGQNIPKLLSIKVNAKCRHLCTKHLFLSEVYEHIWAQGSMQLEWVHKLLLSTWRQSAYAHDSENRLCQSFSCALILATPGWIQRLIGGVGFGYCFGLKFNVVACGEVFSQKDRQII